jgi:hypothetical protein
MSPTEPSRKRAASSVMNSDSMRCTGCRTLKPLTDFAKEGRPDRPFKSCKNCRVCSFTYFIMFPTNSSYRIGVKPDEIISRWIRSPPCPILSPWLLLLLLLLLMSEILKHRLALTLLMFLPQFLPPRRHWDSRCHKALSSITKNCVDVINAEEICL